ncbi:MAG: DNA repair protein RadC [Cytophagales bacterium]|nr:DNA repair protein RadC [Cytophagales bacterium]
MDYTKTLTAIKSWAEEDRPREKMLLKGKVALTDAELLAIIIGSGTRTLSAVDLAKVILGKADNNLANLARFTIQELKEVKGIGEAKAISIVSALELGRRRKMVEQPRNPKISCSADLHTLLQSDFMDLTHEEFWVVFLSRSNQVIRKERISEGGLSGTVADPRRIFKLALDYKAVSIILAHNHPSGNLRPSKADLDLTKKVKSAGESLDIQVLDHLIFTDRGFFSFADEGVL